MCKPGGTINRCFFHKMGTKAAISVAMFMTELPKQEVSEVAKDLKKEGKNLPAPSQDEVDAYVMNQKFTVRHDSRIPEKSRKGILKNLDQAREEQPDGGTYHSWNNVTAESAIRRHKRKAMAILAGGMIVATAACGNVPKNNDTATTPPSSDVSVTAPANQPPTSTTPDKSKSNLPETNTKIREESISKLKSQGIEVNGNNVVKMSDGTSYPQISIGDKQFKSDPVLANLDAPKGWSKDDQARAGSVGATNLYNMAIDHKFNGGDKLDEKSGKEWSNSFKGVMSKSIQKKFEESSSKSNIAVSPMHEQKGVTASGYKYVNDGETPHVKSMKLKVKNGQVFNGGMHYIVEADVEMNAKTGKGHDYVEKSKVTLNYVVVKETDGYKINAYEVNMDLDESVLTNMKKLDNPNPSK